MHRCRPARPRSCCRAPRVAEPVDEPADLVVGVIEEGGKRLLQASRETLLVLGQVVPGFDARIAGGELVPRAITPSSSWRSNQRSAHDVPALVVATPVLVEVAGRCLVRGVGRTERQVGEERRSGRTPLLSLIISSSWSTRSSETW